MPAELQGYVDFAVGVLAVSKHNLDNSVLLYRPTPVAAPPRQRLVCLLPCQGVDSNLIGDDEQVDKSVECIRPSLCARKWEHSGRQQRAIVSNNHICTGFLLMTVLCTGASATTSDSILKIDRFVSAEMSRQKIPGMALAVVKNGQVVLAKGYGFANIEHQVPVTTHSIFQSGSIGKQFTAAAIVLLEEHGKLRLDDKVARYLPRTKASWGSITLQVNII